MKVKKSVDGYGTPIIKVEVDSLSEDYVNLLIDDIENSLKYYESKTTKPDFRLINAPPIVKIRQTCYACPSQWDARLEDGTDVYIRFRHGALSVDFNEKEVFSMYTDHGGGGCMDTDDMLQYTGLRLSADCKAWGEDD